MKDLAHLFAEALADHQAGRFVNAERGYRQVLAANPCHPSALNLLGVLAHQLGRHDAAIELIQRAIVINGEIADFHSNLGAAFKGQARASDAVAAYRTAITLDPSHVEARANLAAAWKDLGMFAEGLEACDQAIEIDPTYPDAHSNRASILWEIGRLEDAAAASEIAIRLRPHYTEAHYNFGVARLGQGDLDGAISACRTAIRLNPDYAAAHFNLAVPHALRGDLIAAWPEYEWRWQANNMLPRGFIQPQWRGEDLAGRTILLHAEQGLGDTLFFSRYAALVKTRGARVVLEAPRSLLRLLSGLKGVDGFIAAGDPLPLFDTHCPLGSLPGAFKTTVSTIPADIPYLQAEPETVQAWRDRIGSEGFKIGIVWQGNPTSGAERGRSAPLSCFAPLAKVPGVRLISLQKLHGLDQLDHLPPGMMVENLGSDFDQSPDAFIDSAAAMMSLDLIVSVDTAIGHLAGALGRPVWLALRSVPYWVWMMERDDSPWYPGHRLFRQTERGDWAGVFRRMEGELMNPVAMAKPPWQR